MIENENNKLLGGVAYILTTHNHIAMLGCKRNSNEIGDC